ncbi:hypothetical protein [Antrihabitans spumae]|uniref:DUF445 domain-containing protein n=3 Tax=Antrihabitans TaxID=2799491 RepID=A0A934NS98_9NOCA|nr:hypothetical protein [Antrihabitans stalagmiti]
MSEIPSNLFNIPWDALTDSKFVLEIVSIPIFSAIAGLLTNWTGVLMLFAPVKFTGFYVPGLKTLFNFFPRKVQILPVFAPGGILGFQGFIPARAEKMAAICCDKAILKIGNVKDFFQELDPEAIAEHIAVLAKVQLRDMVDEVMATQHPALWKDFTPQMREVLYQRVDTELPSITKHAFESIGDNVDQLIDVKLLVVGYLRKNPGVLKDIIEGLGGPELRFMVRIGLMGFPLGLLLAIWLHFYHYIPLIGALPGWLMVLIGAAVIGVLVNILCIKMVFEPGDPQPRYKYIWKQAKFAKRQHEAAGDFGHAIAYQVLTLPNIAHELLEGPRGDKTQKLLQAVIGQEITRVLGPMKTMVRAAVGGSELDSILEGSQRAALDFAPSVLEDVEFGKLQAEKLDKFASQKLRELTPGEFMEMLYAAIEQDAWLLYVHGGLLGVVVGAVHILIFGA